MAAPYWIGDEVRLRFEAVDADGQGPSSVTVDIHDPSNNLDVDDASATVESTTVTYVVTEAVNNQAGVWRAVFSVVFPGTVTRRHIITFLVLDSTLAYTTYGSIDGVESLVGDVVENRTFTDLTVPSYNEVQALLDAVASELNVEMQQQGYTVPVSAADDLYAYTHLIHVNNAGASARVLSSMPAESYTMADEGQSGGDRREMLDRELWHSIQRIRRQELPATRSIGLTARLISGSRTNRDTGDIKQPLFSRGKFDFPSSRTLELSS